jgi:hypothetical protein
MIFQDKTVHWRTNVRSQQSLITKSTLLAIYTNFEVKGEIQTILIWNIDNLDSDIGLIPYYETDFSPVEYIDVMPFDYDHIESLSATDIGFSFVLDRRIFPVELDLTSPLTVTVEISVSFFIG